MNDNDLYNRFILAEHLGKTISEIEEITVSEWNYWQAYFSIKNEREAKNKYKR